MDDTTFLEKESQKKDDLIEAPPPDFEVVTEFRKGVNGIELIPKPAPDDLDPLNFSRWEKAVALGIVMFMSVSHLKWHTKLLTPMEKVFPFHLPYDNHSSLIRSPSNTIQYIICSS